MARWILLNRRCSILHVLDLPELHAGHHLLGWTSDV